MKASPEHSPRVILRPTQVDHVKRIESILREKSHFVIDNSVMRTGKTHTTAYIAQKLEFKHIIVVCPIVTESVWLDVDDLYDLNLTKVIGFPSLRSVTRSQPKHGLLVRTDHSDGTIEFSVTPLFKKLIKSGCLLVGDEFHELKNENVQHKAFKALATYIYSQYKKGSKSRIILLSGTPMDNEVQVSNYFRLLGIINHNKMFRSNKRDGRFELLGLEELIDYCSEIDEKNTTEFVSNNSPNPDNAKIYSYMLYVEIIQKYVTSCMPLPLMDTNLHCYNGYFKISDEGAEELISAIESLNKICVSYNDEGKKTYNRGDITSSMKRIEMAKTEIFTRIASEKLEENKMCKVCIFVTYNEPFETLSQALRKYKPLILNGDVKKKYRPNIIKSFQEHTTEHRLLICKTAICSVGISLDDSYGDMPRFAFGSPDYMVMRMHQMKSRFHQVGTKSDTHVCFVYGECARKESSILRSISKKTGILKSVLKLQVDDGMIFPGDYPNIYESGIPEEVGDDDENKNSVSNVSKRVIRKKTQTRIKRLIVNV
jgi:hypothetical protein